MPTELRNLMDVKWNTDLPPVGVQVLIAMRDGTVWRVKRDNWLASRKDDPNYHCEITDHPLPVSDVLGWRYP